MAARFAPVDAEDALRREIERAAAEEGIALHACAQPVPADLGDALPLAVVTRTGGSRLSMAMDSHQVEVDVYAATEAEAMAAAGIAAGIVAALWRDPGQLVSWREGAIDALPYQNPDPSRPDVPRVTFSASLVCRPAALT